MIKKNLVNLYTWLFYRIDKKTSKSFISFIFYQILLIICITFFFAFLINTFDFRPVDGKSVNFLQSLWYSMNFLLDTGNLSQAEGWSFRILAIFATFIGFILYSTLNGLITTIILDKVLFLRRAKIKVTDKNHVVILGWTPLVFQVIRELDYAFEVRTGSTIVVLSEEDRLKMKEDIRCKLPNLKNTEVICRNGNPLDYESLNLVNISEANSVIVLNPHGENPDSEVIKIILALRNRKDSNKKCIKILSSFRLASNFELRRILRSSNINETDDKVEIIKESNLIAKIIAQTCRRTGLSIVYTILLGFEGVEFYQFSAKEYPRLVGKPFKEWLFHFKEACPFGVTQEKGGIPLMPPPMDLPISKNDKILFVQQNEQRHKPTVASFENILKRDMIHLSRCAKPKPEPTLIIGWNLKTIQIIIELNKLVAKETPLSVASKFLPSEKEIIELEKKLDKISVSFIQGDTANRNFIEELNIPNAGFKRILILGYSENFSDADADSITLITLLHVRDIIERTKHNVKDFEIQLVTELLDSRNQEIANRARPDDFIVSNKFIAMLLAQLSFHQDFELFNLFASNKQQLFLKLASNYVALNETVNFATIVEAATKKGEAAIGYNIKKLCFDPQSNFGCVINPPKDQTVVFDEYDRIIVFSDSESK